MLQTSVENVYVSKETPYRQCVKYTNKFKKYAKYVTI